MKAVSSISVFYKLLVIIASSTEKYIVISYYELVSVSFLDLVSCLKYRSLNCFSIFTGCTVGGI
jgi:hypothetical protein